VPDTLIDIVIHLPGASDVKLKGRVRSSVKTPVVSIKNGMGIEIIENDPRYINFVRSVFPEASEEPDSGDSNPGTSFQNHVHEPPIDEPLQPEFTIIACPECGARNKVNNAKLSLGPRCGKCGHPLTFQA
jgi:predicted Zn finger-like uncharacterized protein